MPLDLCQSIVLAEDDLFRSIMCGCVSAFCMLRRGMTQQAWFDAVGSKRARIRLASERDKAACLGGFQKVFRTERITMSLGAGGLSEKCVASYGAGPERSCIWSVYFSDALSI